MNRAEGCFMSPKDSKGSNPMILMQCIQMECVVLRCDKAADALTLATVIK